MDKRQYLVQLTWLRGIAATLVVISHSIRTSEGKYASANYSGQITGQDIGLINFFDLGTFGVMVFFALSGATLYFSNAKVSLKATPSFYIKRVFRIWPAFFVSLLAYIAFMPLFSHFYQFANGNWIEQQFLASWDLSTFISYVTLTFNITGPSGIFNNAYWSLPIEFQYYLLFPLIILSIKLVGMAGPVLIAIVCYILQKFNFVDFSSNLVFFLAYTFCFGVLAAHIYSKINFRLPTALAMLLALCSAFLCSLTQLSYIDFGDLPIISNPYGYTGIFGLMCVVSILFISSDLPKTHWLVRPFYWLGEVSYSLYLYHNLVLGALVIVCLEWNLLGLLTHPEIIFLIVLPTTLLISHYSYKLIEKPGISLGKRLASYKGHLVERN